MKLIKSATTITAPSDNGDDWFLAGTLFESAQHNAGPAILLSGAAAIPRGFYAAFAQHLVERGARAVLIYDYRGMGDSASPRFRWSELAMKDWALLDFPAAAKYLRDRFPDNELVGIGHSYGGQALGLSGISELFTRYATVATMSGYWRDTAEPLSIYLKTQIVGNSLAKLMGRIPKWGGLGEEMPGRIFIDWTRWIAQPNYFFDDTDLPEISRFRDVTLPFLSVRISDDTWGTKRAVEHFMSHYENADLRHFSLKTTAEKPIGHFAWFRPRNAEHWPMVVNFALAGKWPDGV
ncbi:alpha/beta fold hydrolase [Pseudahrensia aquimaris]|uniref:Alpha/beta fold hydrolase n=1 Tax=Pseudahrensia aquimaris TaxID=744461 RepID=A0ABW3FJQ5_9HYPH